MIEGQTEAFQQVHAGSHEHHCDLPLGSEPDQEVVDPHQGILCLQSRASWTRAQCPAYARPSETPATRHASTFCRAAASADRARAFRRRLVSSWWSSEGAGVSQLPFE